MLEVEESQEGEGAEKGDGEALRGYCAGYIGLFSLLGLFLHSLALLQYVSSDLYLTLQQTAGKKPVSVTVMKTANGLTSTTHLMKKRVPS